MNFSNEYAQAYNRDIYLLCGDSTFLFIYYYSNVKAEAVFSQQESMLTAAPTLTVLWMPAANQTCAKSLTNIIASS